ncbi:NO-inducible flavohemoprotein [Pedobacter gandavensis]|uniref:nitric oxide dioxygenase n=1 Tax=Pedobacter gandavensis TaxID=2679963 RepID=A0ABR6ESG8_9SPHI|nr:NO-inducible flavohemoprotein [Pedobacter gandavensis]MBB2147931.1 NO-inducible flavohemoprotein [Pedobacter gandavensis]
MLSTTEIGLIKATVPILREQGLLLTQHFYKRMFQHNPELRNTFNMGNQQNGTQQTALALAVLAYAENIENPGVLLPVLQRIGDKHTSLQITAEQYDIVGKHLLASIGEVLGDAATADLITAWAKAYGQLADLMINLEKSIYLQKAAVKGAWTGWRKFIIDKKVQESEEITSFYLRPEDGLEVSAHQPGQYLSIKVFVPALGIYQPRQYSISSAPSAEYYRISVKREPGNEQKESGTVSNYLHDQLLEGDVIEATTPAGDFVLNINQTTPLVLLSGGVGQTPFVSILDFLTKSDQQRQVKWAHACRSESVHAFREQINAWQSEHDWFEHIVFYENTDLASKENSLSKDTRTGRMDVAEISEMLLIPEAEYYLCGPKPFIEKTMKDLSALGIDHKKLFFEEFGPQTIQMN